MLSKALGYKGHSDLVFFSKFRAQVKQPVMPIFSDENHIQSIAYVFSSEVKGLNYARALRLCCFLRLKEAVDVKVTTLILSLESKLKALFITAEECERLIAISLPYAEAIVLLSKQSDIALKMIHGDSEQLKEELTQIQSGMKLRSKEISFLLKVTKERNVSVVDIDPGFVLNELIRNNPYFSYLQEKPIWYAAEIDFGELRVRYLTRYFADCQSCGGSSRVRRKLLPLLEDVNPGKERWSKLPESKLLSKVKKSISMPSFSSDFVVVYSSSDKFREICSLG
tara:strand:- start:84 stop:929 length:846 start_codon:yes stop_codon:yes gene_type:complete